MQNDFYPTPEPLVRCLLDRVRLPYRLAEPCAGDGRLAVQLMEAGHNVLFSDIDPRWAQDQDAEYEAIDFLDPTGRALEFYAGRSVVTNPPYGDLAPEFVKQALRLSGFAAMLLPINWFEPCENRKVEAGLPGRCLVFQRCQWTDFTGEGGDSKTVMWRIWDDTMRTLEVEMVSREELVEYAGQGRLL